MARRGVIILARIIQKSHESGKEALPVDVPRHLLDGIFVFVGIKFIFILDVYF